MKKLIFKLLLLLVFVTVILFFLGGSLTKINPYKNFVSEFDKSIEEGNTYDIFFYGSSKSYSTFNPRVFSEVLQVNSFNFGNNGQRLPTSFFVLEETLKKQKPKLLIFELYNQSIKSPDSKENISFQFSSYDAFSFSLNKFKHSLKEFPLNELPFLYLKAIRNHEGWKTIKKNQIDDQNNSYLIEEYNGYRGWQYVVKNPKKYTPLKNINYKIDTVKHDVLDLNQKKNLDQLILITQEYGIPVLFVTAPSLRDLINKNYPNSSVALNNYLNKRNQKYLDLNFKIDSMKLTPYDFRDVIHLNNNGANKVSQYLAKWVYQKYEIGSISNVENTIEEYINNRNFGKNSVYVDKKLTNQTSIKRLHYLETGYNKMTLVMEMELNNIQDLDKYSIMFHALPEDKYESFLSEKSIAKKRKHEVWDFKPKTVIVNGKYYIFKTIETKIKALKTINIGVYSVEGYNGLLHEKITVNM